MRYINCLAFGLIRETGGRTAFFKYLAAGEANLRSAQGSSPHSSPNACYATITGHCTMHIVASSLFLAEDVKDDANEVGCILTPRERYTVSMSTSFATDFAVIYAYVITCRNFVATPTESIYSVR